MDKVGGEGLGGNSSIRTAPSSLRSRIAMVGPGLVVAAAGVGAGDMVSGLVAGANYGTTLIWAVVLGVIIKLCLTEGVGRWYMATGQTIVQGWQSLGRWATVYVMIYLVVLAFIYGAAVPSATALALTAMFPILSVPAWAIVVSVLSFVIVGLGRYGLFERVMEVLVIVMFVTIVGTAVLTAPNLLEVAGGLAPRLPEDSLLYALGVMGGVGATIGVTFYGYWVREKGWRDSSWIPMMRIDATVGYVMTGIFVLAMLVIGSQFLFATGASIEGEEGLVALSDPLAERFGAAARWLFLVGFFATTFSSVVGGWNGFAHLFADLARTLRGVPDEEAGEQLSEKGPYFRILLVWITFPPMFLLLFGQPVLLVVIYTALGAFFQPFLALTLLWLLNWRIARREFRNGWISNAVLAGTVALFVVLMAQEIVGLW